ncbi:hypothetical protein [Streptomyces sp. V3I7]|uniref:hypothetical protein n=1 Tax=Streptomyces sp. V3I7 TaxID=3042278 RepID=UPI0027850E75|nr:hypothetical protein [Streptomyces sp. V3I7]MDQ0992645.1 hypothetical protein [Streptomyces sp. V3I7]
MGDEERGVRPDAGAGDEPGAVSAPDRTATPDETTRSPRPDRTGLFIAGAVLTACAGLVLYGVLDTADKPGKPPVPTAAVTYEVSGEGTADIAYQGRNEAGSAAVDRAVALPWKKTVRVPLGRPPLVSITLGEKGGQASCSLAVRGKHVQTASAFGKFGRATCQAELPSATPKQTEAAG